MGEGMASYIGRDLGQVHLFEDLRLIVAFDVASILFATNRERRRLRTTICTVTMLRVWWARG